MKIKSLQLSYLRNTDHFQFHSGFKELIELLTAAMLKIEVLFGNFLVLYTKENELMDQIHQSNISEELMEADNNRDLTIHGMKDFIKTSTHHFLPEVRLSATHLKSLFDTYGNMAIKTYDDQTIAINRLVEELTGKHAVDVATVGLTEWVSQLKIKNLVFDSLKRIRFTEDASLAQLSLKQARAQVDLAYYAIINRINALIELEGETNYTHFISELNTRIEVYDELLTQPKVRRTKLSPPLPPPEEPINPKGMQM